MTRSASETSWTPACSADAAIAHHCLDERGGSLPDSCAHQIGYVSLTGCTKHTIYMTERDLAR